MQTKTHITKGLYIAAALIILKSVTHFTKSALAEWTVFPYAAIILIGIIVSVFLYNKENSESKKFGTLFTYGFKTTAVVACIYFVFMFLETKLFFPNYIHEKLLASIESLKQIGIIENNNQIEPNLKIGNQVETYKYFAGSLMSILSLGVIGAVLGSVVSKQKNN